MTASPDGLSEEIRSAIKNAFADGILAGRRIEGNVRTTEEMEWKLSQTYSTLRPTVERVIELERDARRWRLFSSSAFRFTGSANFDHSNYPEVKVRDGYDPTKEWLHFGMEVTSPGWIEPDAQTNHGRAMIEAYVQALETDARLN